MYNIIMEVTTECFEKIIIFQEFESMINEEERKKKSLIDEIQKETQDFNSETQKLKDMEEEHKKCLIEKKNLENELYQCEESIKKHQIELNSVKKNEQFKALLTEIENLKNKKDLIENKILEIMDITERKSNEINQKRKNLSIKEKEKDSSIKTKKEEIEKIEKYINDLKSRQDLIKSEIKDETIKKRLENLLKTKNGLAVVKANIKKNETLKSNPEEYFCSGCNSKLTSMDISSIRKMNTFAICQNCSRFIYYRC